MTYDKTKVLQACNAMCRNTLMETLGIEFVDLDEQTITARMPVTEKVHQPDGVLHGGASVALAESVGSAGAHIWLGDKDVQVRGIEIAANHIRSVRSGHVFAKAEILHRGRTTQLWQIRITDEQDRLVSLVKMTTLSLNIQ